MAKTSLPLDPATGTVSGSAVDFLDSLTGPSGNVYSVFAQVREMCRQLEGDRQAGELMYQRFRADLDAVSKDKTYEDVLEVIEAWFGPQTAIEMYRDHMAALDEE